MKAKVFQLSELHLPLEDLILENDELMVVKGGNVSPFGVGSQPGSGCGCGCADGEGCGCGCGCGCTGPTNK